VRLDECGGSTRLVNCTIEGCSTGARINNSSAVLTGNTIDAENSNGRAYGLRLADDVGTTIRGNSISAQPFLGTSYGIYVEGAGSAYAMTICANDVSIGDWNGSGMYFEDVDNTATRIDSNLVTGLYHKSGGQSKGMNFKNSAPTVRWNRIYDFNMASFYVNSGDGDSPDLGDASTTDGNNATDTKATYYVYATARIHPLFGVMAENNWWGTDSPSSAKFYTSNHSIDWHPYLDSDPNESKSRSVSGSEDLVTHRNFLEQNRPNPFNPVTSIAFGLEEEGRALLRIFDVSGRVVRTLVDGMLPAGNYTSVWDGRNDHGEQAATGIYFCRFECGSYTASLKLALIK
jgi:hypothetical protein